MILIEIDGPPVNWVHHQGYGRRAFNPKYKEREFAQWQMRSQYSNDILTCPLEIHMTFYMAIPKTTSAIRKRQMLLGNMRHIKRPDVSNLYYFYENCLKGVVIEDDSQVYRYCAEKVYSLKEKTLIKIYPETDQGEKDAPRKIKI